MLKNNKIKRILLVSAPVAAMLFAAGTAFAQPEPKDGVKSAMRTLFENGEVSVTEFVASAEAQAQSLDSNGDGTITKAEVEANRKARQADRKSRRFPDANNDGVVSEIEFLDGARDRFAKMDANGDGLLTEDEMPKPRGRGRRGGR
ncbi:MAG: EF-hand domain-containing protein [Pseudomonadota bacterium]